MQLSAALSCYILFSLAPLLIIIVSLAGIFFGDLAAKGMVFDQIKGVVGTNAALDIQRTIVTLKLSGSNVIATIVGVSISILAGSRIFSDIQKSINHIWEIKTKHKRATVKFIFNRFLTFIMICSTVVLLLIGLTLNSLMDILDKRLLVNLPELNINFYYTINILILFVLIIILFTALFMILPNGKIALLDGLIGASFTALLFMIGKFAIGYYLENFAATSIHGAAGSILLILFWIYYSSVIFYFGAVFTKVYALTFGKGITPNDYSVRIKTQALLSTFNF
jgi:membrane protein